MLKVLRFFLTLAFTLGTVTASERLPEIAYRDARGKVFPLQLERFALEVERHHDLAETTLTLTFRNETSRQLEGELLLPLPKGAEISRYELEVNGEFRDAVAVEKQQALFAYETIKARRVDPGIVEKEADNTYRTRIFPIEPQSTKSLRISYLEYLPIETSAPSLPRYRHSFNLTSPVAEISVTVKGAHSDLISHPSLSFIRLDNGDREALLQDATLQGELRIEAQDPHRSTLLTSNKDGQSFSYLTLAKDGVRQWTAGAPPLTLGQHPKPETIALFWDASRSQREVNHEPIWQFFNQFFEEIPNITISLIILRNKREESAPFIVKGGDWSALRNRLQELNYDGSSNFQDLTCDDVDLALIYTDGLGTDWPQAPSRAELVTPLVSLLSQELLTGSPLEELSRTSGGASLDLSQLSPQDAFARSLERPISLRSTDTRAEIFLLYSSSRHCLRFLISDNVDTESLHLMSGSQLLGKLSVSQDLFPTHLAKTLFGSAKLMQLQARNAPASEIRAHCHQYSLVSDYTSLLVLEFFDDYLRFRIPPPEQEIRARYEQALQEKASGTRHNFNRFWKSVLIRQKKDYPGFSQSLYKDYRLISIFNHAQKKVFDPSLLDSSLTLSFQSWEKEVIEHMRKERDDFRNGLGNQWLEESDHLREKRDALTKLKAKATTPFEISMLGRVRSSGTITYDLETTLQQAVEQAQPTEHSLWESVALYRSGEKAIYNLLSENFEDFQLLPGDLVVVDEAFTNTGSDGFVTDPFSSGATGASERPAVTFDNARRPLSAQRIENVTSNGSPGNFAKGESQFATFAIEARDLFQAGKPEEAERTLSNLRELFSNNISAKRLEAAMLGEFGKEELELRLLEALLATNPRDYLTAQYLANTYVANGNLAAAIKTCETAIKALRGDGNFTAAAILLTHRNNLVRETSAETQGPVVPQDLRVIITNLTPTSSLSFEVTDPTGFTTTRNKISPTGLTISALPGLLEISDQWALPGTYQLSVSCDEEQLLEVVIYRNFGRPSQTVSRNLLVSPKRRHHFHKVLIREIVIK